MIYNSYRRYRAWVKACGPRATPKLGGVNWSARPLPDPWALQASIFLDFGPSIFQPRIFDGFFIDIGRIWDPFWHHF